MQIYEWGTQKIVGHIKKSNLKFMFGILGTVSRRGGGAGIAASSHRGANLKGT